MNDHISNANSAAIERAIFYRKTSMMVSILSLLFILLVGGFYLYSHRMFLADKISEQIPRPFEESMGSLIFKHIISTQPLIDDSEIQSSLDNLVEWIIPAKRRYNYQFKILKSDDINAYAILGGIIVINSALIIACDSSEELLGVIAHELAHVNQRHGLKQLINSLGYMIIVQLLISDYTSLIAGIASQAEFFISQAYSRDYEREADRLGTQYLLDKNIDPQGLSRFFTKLKEKQGLDANLEKLLSFLSTHPANEQRTEAINSIISQTNQKYISPTFDYEHFKQLIKNKQEVMSK